MSLRLLLAAVLVTSSVAGASAQIADLGGGSGTVGERAARASSKSAAELRAAERRAGQARRADEVVYKKRAKDMHRSLGSICHGC